MQRYYTVPRTATGTASHTSCATDKSDHIINLVESESVSGNPNYTTDGDILSDRAGALALRHSMIQVSQSTRSFPPRVDHHNNDETHCIPPHFPRNAIAMSGSVEASRSPTLKLRRHDGASSETRLRQAVPCVAMVKRCGNLPPRTPTQSLQVPFSSPQTCVCKASMRRQA
jgi:hypothetical protein